MALLKSMNVISLTNAQLAFGHVALLDHAEFSLDEGERVGLIGRNGVGKSSILKVITGNTSLDDGSIAIKNGIRIAYVNQEPYFEPEMSIFDAVASGMGATWKLLNEYRVITSQLGDSTDEATIEFIQELQNKLDDIGAWDLINKVEIVLNRFALDENLLIGNLSGGLKKRVALACALVNDPNVLLLDEPTNHLDFNAIIWLEKLLGNYKGSILFVTHDRHFLDRVATRIVELDRGRILSFPGNFTAYESCKLGQLTIEKVENAKFDKFLAKEEAWICKGVQARRTRDEGRVRRLKGLRLARAQRNQVGQVRMDISSGERSGKIVSKLVDVNKSFGSKAIVRNFSATIMRGEKIGLIGDNGAGKTTLLKLILGTESPDSGEIKKGTKLQIAYFDQMRTQLNEEASLVDAVLPGSDWVQINNQHKHVITYLRDFLFSSERVHSPVKSLSGGERNRLLLARLFASPANVLVLDEPTNDLDIDTLELLEGLLVDYSGTVFLVSHDRVFLDNIVTQVIASEGDGRWLEYVGGYTDWERARPIQKILAVKNRAESKPEKIQQPIKQKKLSYKQQRELEELPLLITKLEQEQKTIFDQLADPYLYKQKSHEAKYLNDRLVEIDSILLSSLERWEEIETIDSQ